VDGPQALPTVGGPGVHPFKEAVVLIRITWGLVLLGLGLVIGGFLTSDSNVLLILAIAVEIAAIVLVLASWARRAREATEAGAAEELAYASDDTDQTQEEELFAALESDEEFAVGGRRAVAARPATRPARKTTGSSPARKSTAPKSSKSKPAAAARKKAPAKSTRSTSARAAGAAKKPAKAKPTSKAKPKAKPKAKGTTSRPKATPPRPPTASS
jgi:hypothetical protein